MIGIKNLTMNSRIGYLKTHLCKMHPKENRLFTSPRRAYLVKRIHPFKLKYILFWSVTISNGFPMNCSQKTYLLVGQRVQIIGAPAHGTIKQ